MTTVFTGHRIDEPDRPAPRFPASRAPVVATWIAVHIAPNGPCLSSLASGGDILFAEACRAAGCVHDVVLPFGPDRFLESSVATEAPGDWEARFRRLWDETPPQRRHVLAPEPEGNPYDACNRALIRMARAAPGPHRLLAVWDGADSGRPGGTSSMIALARESGFTVETFDPRPKP